MNTLCQKNNLSRALIQIGTQYETPFLLFSEKVLRQTCQVFKKCFPTFGIYYSVKANNTLSVLDIINSENINFEIASQGELCKLRDLHIQADRIVFSAPTKLPRDIDYAYAYGVRSFAFDSYMELEKLARYAPGSNVYARLIVDNTGSDWPLVGKFGVTSDECAPLFFYAKKLGLVPYGLAFHVGSQNHSPVAWKKALETVCSLENHLYQEGISLSLIDMGGGFPVTYKYDTPSIKAIARIIHTTIKNHCTHDMKFIIEPGRSMVADAGILVTSVINRAHRSGAEWLYVDAGVYHGLQETIEGFSYTIRSEKCGSPKSYTLCGPTCDSTDIIMKDVMLSHDLTYNDRLYIFTAGAYTTSYESYNGYSYPKTYPWSE